MASRAIFTNGVATVTEQSINISVADIFFVSNDETSGGDVYLNFNGSMATDSNYMVVKPGEQFENIGTECRTIYYKSSTGTVNFRVYGRKN